MTLMLFNNSASTDQSKCTISDHMVANYQIPIFQCLLICSDRYESSDFACFAWMFVCGLFHIGNWNYWLLNHSSLTLRVCVCGFVPYRKLELLAFKA